MWLQILVSLQLCGGVSNAGTVEQTGDVLRILLPAIGFGSTIVYEEGYEGTIQFAKAFATSELATRGLKFAVDKERPNGNCCESFPSGHTSAAFMGASFIQERYNWKYALPAYIGAGFVGYSRVHADEHFVEDVLAGAAIGILSSVYFTEPYKGFTMTPTVGSQMYGITFSRTW